MPTRLATSVSTRLSVTRSRFAHIAALAALLVCCANTAEAAPTGLLNDTGQTLCDNGSNVMAACNVVANTGDAATYKRQDGRFGRDAAAAAGALVPAKVGGGMGGFDFTRVCFNGAVAGTSTGVNTCTGTLVANITGAATGTPSTDWACTKDNVTNLIWSLQTQTQTATWTAATAATYPNAGHNTPARCGFNTGWRLPTRRELLGIVLFDGSSPSIDASYFPLTQSSFYWTSDIYAPNTFNAWFVAFDIGFLGADYKTFPYYVRLVRSGQ